MENNSCNHDGCDIRSNRSESADSLCPECGRKGQSVPTETVRHIVKATLIRQIGNQVYKFCRTPTCSIVYYVPNGGPSYKKGDLRVRVGLKETEDPVWVCYCFDISEKQIQEEMEPAGQSTASRRIRKEVEAGNCECEIKNPSGRCCLGEVRAVEKRLLRYLVTRG